MYKKQKKAFCSSGSLTVSSKAWLYLKKKKIKGEKNALTFLLNATSWRIIDRGLMNFHGILIATLLHIYVSSCADLNLVPSL